jgi:endogenous inhibitor of DNA gyrase (YacG/DUF329 family)
MLSDCFPLRSKLAANAGVNQGMSEVIENFEKQLEFIVDCRKRNRRNGYVLGFVAMPLLLLAVLMPILQFLLVPIMMLALGVQIYSTTKTAQVKCPRCGHGYSGDGIAFFPLTNRNCQNCDLSLYTGQKYTQNHDKEWRE